jgi:pyruvate/2-oxoglutarate dehydrogenase complex dihydrolipoamide acyltransferase (E2) component
MASEIIIPDFGTSVDTVRLIKWLKEEGQAVQKGDVLCELETDKAATELESFVEGVLLQQLVEAGSEIEIGTVSAYIGQQGEEIPN